jgi:hypothetical protein
VWRVPEWSNVALFNDRLRLAYYYTSVQVEVLVGGTYNYFQEVLLPVGRLITDLRVIA